MSKRYSAALVPLLLLACDRAPAVRAEDAVVTLPALPGQPGAAFFALESNASPERLMAVSTAAAERVELHQTVTRGKMIGMAPLDRPAFNADGNLAFAPGGRHAMLFGLKPGLKSGDRVTLRFAFERAKPVAVEAEVRGPGMGHARH